MRLSFVVLSALVVASAAQAQVIDPFYAANYSFVDLGSVNGVPANYGGLSTLPTDSNTLIIGGAANGPTGALYSIGVIRDIDGHITGFSGTASQYAEAPYNDGGVVFHSSGVLFASRWPVNEMAQYLPGSTTADKVTNLAALGVAGSNSSLQFGPAGRSYAGRMKLVSYSGGQFYDVAYAPDGSGTFDLISATLTATLQGGPEGMAYVPLGSTLFGDSMLVAEYAAGNIASYDVDANGDPIMASRKVFMSGLSGAEGAFIDPVTGDFIFSTFGGGNRVIRVTGFAVPEPGTIAALGLGLAVLARRRRRK